MSVQIKILVDGLPIEGIDDNIYKVIVDSTIGLPGMFQIILEDLEGIFGDFNLLDSKKFGLGRKLEIQVKVDNEQDSFQSLIKGYITTIEPNFAEMGNLWINIRGYDSSIKLSQGKKTRTFTQQSISDAVTRIISANGLTPDVDSTNTVLDQLIQLNQTDWEFIQIQARRQGYQVYCQGETLSFKEIGSLSSASIALEWGLELASFRPKITALGQKSKANAYGWDLKKKEAITESASSVDSHLFNNTGESSSGSSEGEKLAGSDELDNIINLPIQKTDQGQDLAKASLINAESQYIQAEGETYRGFPALLAGSVVKIKGVGKQFSGEYLVTEARHEIQKGQYRVHFSNHGVMPETMSSLLSTNEPSLTSGLIQGVVPAIVTNVDDSQAESQAAQVKLKYPWLPKDNGADWESDWARVAVVGGGAQRGIYFSPEVNDEVLVAFEQGDINRPYVLGGLWNGTDKPAEEISKVYGNNQVNLRLIKTRSGHQIILDDTNGSEKITIIDKTQKNSIVIDSSNNTVTIKSDQDMVFDAGGKLTFTCKGDFSVSATGAAKLDSKSSVNITGVGAIDVKSDQEVTVENAAGNKVDVAAAGVTVQGITTAVKGSGMVQIQGGIVQIN